MGQERERRREERERRRRARRARKALLAFLKRLRKGCQTFETVDEWLEAVGELRQLLEAHADSLTAEQRRRLERAMELADRSRSGIRMACKALQLELERVIRTLPVGLLGLPVPALVALGVGAAAVVVAGGAWLLGMATRGTSLTVVNQGCPPLKLTEGIPPGLLEQLSPLGVEVPDQVPTDGRERLRFPTVPTTLTVDGTRPRLLALRLPPIRPGSPPLEATIPLHPSVTGLTLDGVPLLGREITLPLGQPGDHTLVVTCGEP